MGGSEPLLSTIAVLAGVIALVVDGRRALSTAIVAVGLGLAPTAASIGGGEALLVLLSSAAVALIAGVAARALASRASWVAGLDPTVPVLAPRQQLFGPRSVRVFVAAISLPAASWVSFNVPVGAVAVVQGLLFPAAYIWTCGALRMVVARTVADVAIGAILVSLGSGVGWLVRGGSDATTGLVIASALPPFVAAVAGWLAGRHSHRAAALREPAA